MKMKMKMKLEDEDIKMEEPSEVRSYVIRSRVCAVCTYHAESTL